MDENAAAYAGVVTGIRTMIKHAGDASNLILDPDLDTSPDLSRLLKHCARDGRGGTLVRRSRNWHGLAVP